jgi:hypothetical protein
MEKIMKNKETFSTDITAGDPVGEEFIIIPESAQEKEEREYAAAVKLVRETDIASTTLIQRNLEIGYNKATRFIQRMENEGIVSAPDPKTKKREVLMTDLSDPNSSYANQGDVDYIIETPPVIENEPESADDADFVKPEEKTTETTKKPVAKKTLGWTKAEWKRFWIDVAIFSGFVSVGFIAAWKVKPKEEVYPANNQSYAIPLSVLSGSGATKNDTLKLDIDVYAGNATYNIAKGPALQKPAVKPEEKKQEVKKPENTGAGDGNKSDLAAYKNAFNAKQYQKTIDEIKKIINNPAAWAKLSKAEKIDIYSKAATSRAGLGDAENSKQNFGAAAAQFGYALANIEELQKLDNSKANQERKALIAKKKLAAEQQARTNTGRSGKAR